MKKIISGKKIRTLSDLHRELKTVLDLPPYYGENLDVLWDSLSGDVNMPLTIEWTNFEESERYLGKSIIDYLNLFQDAEKKIPGFKLIKS